MRNLTKNLPESPGVYIFKGTRGKVLYIGKAGNIKRRVSSYFSRSEDPKFKELLSRVKAVDFQKTDTVIEALILEAELIRALAPKFNIKEKDDKSFLYVEITDEEFPRVLLVRGKDVGGSGKKSVVFFGPFTSATNIRAALKIVRKIFPYSTHNAKRIGKETRACLDYQISLCPGTCVGEISKTEYKKNIRHIKLFFEGKKVKIIRSLTRDMKEAAKKLQFERAARLRKQIFALQHIKDIAFITRDEIAGDEKGERIEGYDISNISGTSSVGSMAVFIDGKPARDKYRLFKIRKIKQSDDVGMLREVIERRLGHEEWQYPDIIMVDGGKGQVNAAKEVLAEAGMRIPVVGIAKGPTRRNNEFVGRIPKGVTEISLIQLRDEAHRFAINYHRKVRGRQFIS